MGLNQDSHEHAWKLGKCHHLLRGTKPISPQGQKQIQGGSPQRGGTGVDQDPSVQEQVWGGGFFLNLEVSGRMSGKVARAAPGLGPLTHDSVHPGAPLKGPPLDSLPESRRLLPLVLEVV